ncbi:tetratricopeptide repeat domain protein [Aspergillus nomiae NRRL 13137]|uniref:Tetratricopeptide repeat domain protein n=1 Tax=Aspergillus nomiae NRRL (strain ATCC 15546 / NRRL 13137 / CBS 260.88 / M93) TaxID=1509407 RepID=A0A0L1INN0_ASPN3|nr:tetratricopeptide repeat domain protein [Aspergillus nomiae NRRL 13137]KNG81171.1 tetratricopeptide repeat domain protein [Aspergillus nomiae NRRL 13137]
MAAQLEDCTIVWLCPLEIELRAAIAMLDKVFDDSPSRAKGQNVVYTIGEVGSHKVAVVGYYQEQGLAVSGSMVAEVLRDLPNLEMGLLVGIAGGIPSPTRDIRLGDVAVAVPEADRPGVVGYDLGKAGENDIFELKHWQNATHPLLRSVINVIRARNESGFLRHLCILEERPEFQKPGNPRISDSWSWDQQSRSTTHPMIHYGTILSGNSVIKSQVKRDHLRDKYGGIAVEMEAAGIMTRLPVAVIRGISDFADSSKNDAWQPYAAITAAAYAKEVLVKLPTQIRRKSPGLLSTPFADLDTRLAYALPDMWAFVGREEELSYLEETLGFEEQQPLQKSIVGLWGLSGVGKSQLASRFVHQQRSKHPMRDIFWITGETREALEQSVIKMLRGGNHPALSESMSSDSTRSRSPYENRAGLVDTFFAELNRLEDQRWLLVIDGISGQSYLDTLETPSLDIHRFIGRLKRGYILLIAKRRDLVEMYHPICEIRGLKNEDAVKLLQLQVDTKLIHARGMEELSTLLKGHPLALRLAASVISRYRYEITDFLGIWKNREADSLFLETNKALCLCLDLSFHELETTNTVAANILSMFSFLDYGDLWYDLCLTATDDTYPGWLRELAKEHKAFENYYPVLADLSFIELKFSVNGQRFWEIHPAIQAVARQRAMSKEQEYIRCVVSLVAAQVPRSYEENFWNKMRRLEPHAIQCWSYIVRGRWGPRTNLTELESLGRLFRHLGRYSQASFIYKMIEKGLDQEVLTIPRGEFLSDVLTNLGLAYIGQREYDLALHAFDKSWSLRSQLGSLTPDITMSIIYNKSVAFMMTGRLEEAEENLRKAASHFARHTPSQYGLTKDERKRLYIRILNDMGEVLLRKGSVAAATDIFSHILDSQRGVLGESHPTIVSTKVNLGKANTQLGEFSIAQSLLQDVIFLYAEWWGRRHPDTMRVVDELASAFMVEGEHKMALGVCAASEFQSAEELWKEALDFYGDTYGNQSHMAGRIKTNLHYLYSLKL